MSLDRRLASLEAIERERQIARNAAFATQVVDRAETDAELRAALEGMCAFTDRMPLEDPPVDWQPHAAPHDRRIAEIECEREGITYAELRCHLWQEARAREHPEYIAMVERVSERCRDLLEGRPA